MYLRPTEKPKDKTRENALIHAVKNTWDENTSPVIGSGGFGEVRRIHPHSKKQMLLVFKVNIKKDSNTYRDSLEEAKRHFQMNHPNIISCLGYASIAKERRVLLLFPQAKQSLRQMLEGSENETSPLSECLSITRQVAEGLAYIHKQGCVHGDVASKNILLDNTGKPLITDFGLAACIGSRNPNRNVSEGDEKYLFLGVEVNREVCEGDLYLPPESYIGETRELISDVFCLGVVGFGLYKNDPIDVAWTNKPGYNFTECKQDYPHFLWPDKGRRSLRSLRTYISSTKRNALKRLRPEDDQDLQDRFLNVIEKCMDVDPKFRIKTAGEVSEQLQALENDPRERKKQ